MRRTILASLCLSVVACSSQLQTRPELASLPNVSFHGSDRVGAGKLEPADIPKLAAGGIGTVIDLRDDSETPDFDEGAAVRAAGMRYQNLPIRGPQDLTAENVRTFDALLRSAGNTPTLIHCASSNRVGALMALRAGTLQGMSSEAAIELGKAWGLASLEPAVREQLAR
ncbi:MAG: protein tyrosine phosphatase family protein [Gammaproteobacteria bacterium]